MCSYFVGNITVNIWYLATTLKTPKTNDVQIIRSSKLGLLSDPKCYILLQLGRSDNWVTVFSIFQLRNYLDFSNIYIWNWKIKSFSNTYFHFLSQR